MTTFKAVFLSNLKKITKGNFKVFLSTPENVFFLKTKYNMIVNEKNYYLKKFRGLKSQQYRVVALEVKMVKFKNDFFQK